jgi:hypothetical protein
MSSPFSTTSSRSSWQETNNTITPPYPQLNLPHVFKRLALTDPNITGQPIRFLSSAYTAGANSLKVGSCTFLNLAYGAHVECGLRVEPPALKSSRHIDDDKAAQTVILQIVQRVVNVKRGNSTWLLCSEVDVTASFNTHVRAELCNVLTDKKNRNDNPLYSTDYTGVASSKSDSDIWLQLARTLEHTAHYNAPTTTRLPSPGPSSSALPTASATTRKGDGNVAEKMPALTDLLSLLTELRFLHRQFFLLQHEAAPPPPPVDTNNATMTEKSTKKATESTGMVEMTIPFISSSLYTSLTTTTTTTTSSSSSSTTPTDTNNTPLSLFLTAATRQSKTWMMEKKKIPLSSLTTTTTTTTTNTTATPRSIFRDVLTLPNLKQNSQDMGTKKNKCDKTRQEEGERKTDQGDKVGIYGIWVDQDNSGTPKRHEKSSSSNSSNNGFAGSGLGYWVCFLVPVGVEREI